MCVQTAAAIASRSSSVQVTTYFNEGVCISKIQLGISLNAAGCDREACSDQAVLASLLPP